MFALPRFALPRRIRTLSTPHLPSSSPSSTSMTPPRRLLVSLANPNQLNQMGVSTGWGGGARLVGIVGRRAALRLLAWSTPVTADEGLALGLVDAVAAEEGGALAEAWDFLGGVLKHDARGQLCRVCVCVCVAACAVACAVCCGREKRARYVVKTSTSPTMIFM